MAGLCCLAPYLFVFFALFLRTSESTLTKVITQSYRASGVFLLTEGQTYTLNFTAARDACLSLNVTIATELQMTQAIQHGLETCKYGWIAEQTAVIPRISSQRNCGKGSTGLVKWPVSADKMFGVFCFNASALTDLETTARPQSSTSSTPLTALTRTSTSSPPSLASTSQSMSSTNKPVTTTSPQSTPSTPAFAVPVETSQSAGISPPASPSLTTFSAPAPVSLPPLTTSKPSAVTFIFTTSTHAFNFPVSSESMLPQPESTANPSLGDLDVALIILGIVLLLLTAAGIMWYYKFYVFSCMSQGQQMDEMETEMWKCTDSEMDPYGQDVDDDEEESYRKYSSDIMLCVKPDMNTNSLD